MFDQEEDFKQVKEEFARDLNLAPDNSSNSKKLLRFYYAQSLRKNIEANKPKPVRYRQTDIPDSMMSLRPELQAEGLKKSGLYHGLVNGYIIVDDPDNDGQKEILYTFALVEDEQTGQFYKVDPVLIEIVK